MNTEVTVDLEDLQFSMESLLKQLPKLPLKQKIDVAARLRGIAKAVKSIDDHVKDEIQSLLQQVGSPVYWSDRAPWMEGVAG